MSYYTVQMHDGELYHHGILGMKWGKKQGPPYPLDASDHSSAEKKAGWRKSLGATVQKLGQSNVNRATSKARAKQAYKSGKIDKAEYKQKLKDADAKNRKETREALGLNKSRAERAAEAAKRDADNLRKAGYTKEADAVQKVADKNKAKAEKKANKSSNYNKMSPEERKAATKKALKTGALVAGTALAAYGIYKVNKNYNDQIKFHQQNIDRMNNMRRFAEQTASAKKDYAAMSKSISNGEASATAILDHLTRNTNSDAKYSGFARSQANQFKENLVSDGSDFLRSVKTAEKVGVPGSEILRTLEDADDFFLGDGKKRR